MIRWLWWTFFTLKLYIRNNNFCASCQLMLPVYTSLHKSTIHEQILTMPPMFSPAVLGCLPMAQRRQSTSSMVLIFSSSSFFSGSLVTSVTSRPRSVLLTDFTWVFFHKSMPLFCSSLVQFALMKASKFLKTYRENMGAHVDTFQQGGTPLKKIMRWESVFFLLLFVE